MTTDAETRRLPPEAYGAAAMMVFAAASALFAWRVAHGIRFLPFGDEAGHMLGAEAIHHGDVLYRDYIDAHGPVTFMLCHLWGTVFGFDDPASMRLIPALAVFGAALALRAGGASWSASAIFLGAAAAFWIVQGLYLVSYFPIGGAFLVAELALHAWPAIFGRHDPARSVVAGAAAIFACFTAYSFAPAALLLGIAGVAGTRRARGWLAGAALGLAINVAWLLAFADPVGFLVYHVIANQIFYAPYSGFGWRTALASLIPSSAPVRLVQGCAVIALAGAAMLGAGGAHRNRLVLSLVVLAILTLDARGLILFQNGAFLLGALALLALAIGERLHGAAARVVLAVGLVVAAELCGRHALATPSGLTRAELGTVAYVPVGLLDDPESREIRRLTAPDDRILVLPYAPEIFMHAGRLPIRKYHDYLPWEADYARHPWFGRDRDLCRDLPREAPKVIWFEDWNIWGRYAPHDYMPCVIAALRAHYREDAFFPHLWILEDQPHDR